MEKEKNREKDTPVLQPTKQISNDYWVKTKYNLNYVLFNLSHSSSALLVLTPLVLSTFGAIYLDDFTAKDMSSVVHSK